MDRRWFLVTIISTLTVAVCSYRSPTTEDGCYFKQLPHHARLVAADGGSQEASGSAYYVKPLALAACQALCRAERAACTSVSYNYQAKLCYMVAGGGGGGHREDEGLLAGVETHSKMDYFQKVCPPLVSVARLKPFHRCDQFQCPGSNGRCVYTPWVCDGEDDCGDGADEVGCDVINVPACPEYTCPSDGTCLPDTYVCDGDADCADAADESVCPPPAAPGPAVTAETEACAEFTCASSGDCTFWAFVCDGDEDCGDGSDEAGCPPPDEQDPGRDMQVREAGLAGDTEAALCVARGGFPCSPAALPCVPAAWACDGEPDCPDASDEQAAAGC